MKEWMKNVKYDDLTDAQKRFADAIGVEATLVLCDAFGGAAIYIPMNETVYNTVARDPEIVRLYLLGVKVATIATRFGMSEQAVFRIVKGSKPDQMAMEL